MTTQLVRIPLAYPIGTRSGVDLSKDPYIRNGMIEQYGQTFRVVKRPGTHTQASQPAPTGTAQGLTFYNSHYFVVVNDILYRTAGTDPISADGTAFTQAPVPLWMGRAFFTATVFNNRIYVIGGEATQDFADINYTADGIHWAQNSSGGPFLHRQGHQVVVLNNVMYLIGGLQIDPGTLVATLKNDVWSTTDGANWTQVTAAAPWVARDNHTCVAGNNGIYLYGGDKGGGSAMDDVWFTVDGKTWTQLSAAATGTGRFLQSMFFFNSKVWIIGGDNGVGGLMNEAWQSVDGQTWTVTAGIFATGRSEMASTIYQGKMWLFGGITAGGVTDSNVYSSSTGTSWTLVTASPGFGHRGGAAAVTFQTPTSVNQFNYQTMWVLGGANAGINLQEVWRANLNVNSPTSYTLSPDVTGQRYQFTTYINGTKLIVKNSSNLWVLAAGVLTKVTDPNYPVTTVSGVVEMDGTLYVMTPQAEIHGCQIDDPLTWPSLNFITADYEDDPGVALAKHLNFVVAFGSQTTQLFYDNGVNQPTGSPLAPYQVANVKIGCTNDSTVVNCGGTLYWVGSGTSNARSVFRFNGVSPEVVSSFYVDRILGENTSSGTIAFELGTVDGRPLYVLKPFLSTEYLVYDTKFNEWYEWDFAFADTPLFFSTQFNIGSYTCLSQLGQLLDVTQDFLNDDGTPFSTVVQTLQNDHGNMARKFWGRVSLVADKVSTTVTIEATDDDYQTFTSFGTVDCSLDRPQITRLGSSRRRAWRITQADSSASIRPEALEIEYSQGES